MNAQHRPVCHLYLSRAVETAGEGFYRIGHLIAEGLSAMGAGTGLLSVFLAHTSASLCVQENADPDVLHDLSAALKKLAPWTGALSPP
jgi:secondary thiamine-phosphate synthase enzyme